MDPWPQIVMAGKSMSDNGILVVFKEVRVGLSCQASNAYFVVKNKFYMYLFVGISSLLIWKLANETRLSWASYLSMQRAKEACSKFPTQLNLQMTNLNGPKDANTSCGGHKDHPNGLRHGKVCTTLKNVLDAMNRARLGVLNCGFGHSILNRKLIYHLM